MYLKPSDDFDTIGTWNIVANAYQNIFVTKLAEFDERRLDTNGQKQDTKAQHLIAIHLHVWLGTVTMNEFKFESQERHFNRELGSHLKLLDRIYN